MKEIEIILSCKQKDRKGQRAFVDQYSSFIFGICLRYMHDKSSAKDAMQESLIHLLHAINGYQHQNKFHAWLRVVTVSKCLELIRKEKKHKGPNHENIKEPSIEESISLKLEKEDVLNFMNTLPDNYRIAINMYLVEGYTHSEIAQKLNITKSSSRSLVSRGRKMINNAFKAENTKEKYKTNEDKYPHKLKLKII